MYQSNIPPQYAGMTASIVCDRTRTVGQVRPEQPESIKSELQQTPHNLAVGQTPLALAHFNELPDCGYVRLPVVLALLGCSKATLWRHVKCSRVPSPKKLSSRISVWQVGTLRAYLRSIESSGLCVPKEGGK